MHNHSNNVFRCRKPMQSPKNRNLIFKKNAVTYLSFNDHDQNHRCTIPHDDKEVYKV